MIFEAANGATKNPLTCTLAKIWQALMTVVGDN